MTRFVRLLAILTCAAATAAATIPAHAAAPAGATLSKTKRAASWTGAATTLSSPMPDPFLDCNLMSDPFCDHFTLKINLGEGAKISVQIRGTNPADPNSPTKPYNDFDIYITSPDGTTVAVGTTPSGNENVTFSHRAKWRNKPYDIAVRPWLVTPGDGYKGTVKAVTSGK